MTARHPHTRTPAAVAELAYAAVLATSPRTPARRAAVCLYIAATVPPAKTIGAIRNAITTFGTEATQAAARALLDRITTGEPTP